MISRRVFLRRTATVGAAGAALAIPVAVEAKSEMPAQERFDFHLAELKKAALELDPRIGSWHVCLAEDEDLMCPIVISAHRVTGYYDGDGQYEGGVLSALGRPILYMVELLPERVDGHRMFSVRTSMDRMVLAEPRLKTFIGRRVA